MTENDKISMLAKMLNEEDEDLNYGILKLYLDAAKEKILNRLYPLGYDITKTKLPDRYDMKQLAIASYLFNKQGAEGQIQHIENGIHRNYGSADVPDGMLSDIVPFCKVIR